LKKRGISVKETARFRRNRNLGPRETDTEKKQKKREDANFFRRVG